MKNRKYLIINGFLRSVPAVFLLLSGSLYRYAFYRTRSRLSEKLLTPQTHSEDFLRSRRKAAEEMDLLPHEVFHIRSDRGDNLTGYYYPSGSGRSGKVCYMVHGYRGNHTNNAGPYVRYYLDQGIDVFSDDHVACGESDGRFIGYDYFESSDCLKWIEHLRSVCGEDVQIILHGFSMGGATVLRISDQCPDNIRFIVSDSGFASAEDLIFPQVPLLQKWLDFINYHIAGYHLRDTDVRSHVQNTLLPVLFMHGTDDPTVPSEYGEELYRICSAPDKHLFMVYNARHVEAGYVDSDGYFEILDEYIQNYLD